MRVIKYIIIGVMTVCVLTACSERYTAISLVQDFIEKNSVAPDKIEKRQFGKLGSTHLLNDSIIKSLHQKALGGYKSDNVYSEYQQGDTLFYIIMSYTYEGDTLSQTFYLDQQLKHIVAVK